MQLPRTYNSENLNLAVQPTQITSSDHDPLAQDYGVSLRLSLDISMLPYGLVPLVASVILTGVLMVGLLLLSLACYFGLLHFPLPGLILRVALCVFILLYLKAHS